MFHKVIRWDSPDWLKIIGLGLPFVVLGLLLFVMGIFFKPMEAEFGWSRTVTSSGYTAFTVCYGISAVIMGRVLDKYGFRLTFLLAALFTGGAVVLLSLIQTPGQFRVLMMIAGLSAGGCFVGPTTVAQQWFGKSRGHVLGFVTCGFGIGALVFAPLLNHFIELWGWRESYFIIGLYIMISLIISVLIIGRNPDREEAVTSNSSGEQVSSASYGWTLRQVLRSRFFKLVFLAFCLGGISFTLLSVHLVPYALDSGISAGKAATALGIMGGAGIPVRLGIGFLQQRFSWRRLFIAGHIGMAAAVAVTLHLDSVLILYTYAIIFGLSSAVIAPVLPGLLGEAFGMSSLGSIIGICLAGSLITGGILGPLLGGISYDTTQSYFLALVVALTLLVISVVLLIVAKLPSMPVDEQVKRQ
ncbi:MAG: MFS transporter [Dehalococcoidia bacterium]|nr:MFS transporter [Dehalococcoidia bacterium]